MAGAVGIVGCAGRMGRMLVQMVLETDGLTLAGGTEPAGSDALGQDLGALVGFADIGITVTDDAAALFAVADVVIDFTIPEATVQHARLAVAHNTAMVIGTTGLAPDQQAVLADAAQHVAIVQAANMSVGVTVLESLVQRLAGVLDEDTDIEIVEMHHGAKIDAPSGTALTLGKAAAVGRDVSLDEAGVFTRHGRTGARARGTIGFAALRGGDVVGDHTVIFASQGERIELTHKASSRTIFAKGAVRAARWVLTQPPGLYSMHDVLGLTA